MRDKVKRFISILMTALMLVNLMPVGALADGITSGGYQQSTISDVSRTVYVYVKVTGNTDGLVLNTDGWYTIGTVSIKNMPNPETYSYSGSGVHVDDVYLTNGTTLNANSVTGINHEKNTTIPLGKVTWTGTIGKQDFGFVRVRYGAADYVGNGWTWHLDGYVNVEDVKARYTIRYVNQDTGEVLEKDAESGEGKLGSTITYNKAPYTFTYEGKKYTRQGDQNRTFKLVSPENTFNIYYRRPYGYTVEYYYDGVKDEKATVTVTDESNLCGTVINTYTPKQKNGYEFDKKENLPLTIQADESKNVIKVYYKKQTDLSYKVNYYWNGTTTKVATSKTVDKQTFDSTVTESPVTVKGYTPVSNESQSITIKANSADNVINFYYYKNVELTANSDTKTYDGTQKSVSGFTGAPEGVTFEGLTTPSATGTDAKTYPADFAEGTVGTVDATEKYIVTKATDGSLTISKRSVVLTSETASKPYDGTALTKPDVAVTGDGFVDGEVTDIKATGSVTYVSDGEVTNTITYTEGANFKTDNYDIQKHEGKLSITETADEVVVTITGHNNTVTYNGSEQSITGYDVDINNKLYKESDFKFSGNAEAKGTDANTYPMNLKAEQFSNTNKNFSKVTFKVTDGSLTISKRSVVLTSETASKPYDGTALTKPDVAVTGDGFVDGEVTDIKATGSVTYVSDGEVTNTITYTEGEKFKADNYTIEKNEGKLSINPVTDKVTVTVKEKSGTATYDGMNHTVSGYESMTADNPLYDVEDSVDETPTANWAANGTDAGEYPVGIEAGDFENTNKNFSNVTFVVEDGSLTITPAQVTLQAPIQSKPYDGTPLEATQFGHSYLEGLDFADDFAAVILTGSQTLVGSSSSLITEVIPKEGKKLKNYKFTFLPGTLTITDGTGDDPVKPESVVTKTHFKTDMGYNLGEPVTFTVSVTNIYNEQKEVTLEEQPGVTFVDPQGAAIGTKATKTLEPGEKWTIQATYTITLDDILADGFTNKVKANFKGGKSWNAEDYVETRDPYIELDVTKTADVDKAALGQTITYTITVDYQSNVPGKKVEVKDPLTGLETSFTTEEALEGKTVTFTTTYTVTEQDVKNGIVKNTATVKSELDNEWMPADVETPTFAPITIKPKDVTATYNGAAITGKDVEITSGKLLEGHKLSAAVIGSGVNAGSYELTLDPEKITIVDANNNDVSEMYARTLLPGKLIINKRSVLITSQSATKTYDGSALTRPVVTITGDGFVPGELAKAEATGSITNVGSTPNTIQYTTTGAFNAANYSIALSVGTLTVTEKPKPEPRRTFNLTINYVYQNGKRAAASYNRGGLKNGETFDITSPVIAGYTASETVVSGTIYNRDIKVTVIYTADGVNLDDYGVPLGLGNITMNVGDCFE